MAKIYSGFASPKQKGNYLCKSEITRSNLRKMGIPDFIEIKEVNEAFEELEKEPFVYYIRRGNLKVRGRNRVTKYVNKHALYKKVIKR